MLKAHKAKFKTENIVSTETIRGNTLYAIYI